MINVFKNKGFSLIELIIVLIIIGVVYSFVGNSFIKAQKKENISLKNLPKIIRTLQYKTLEINIFGRECDKIIWFESSNSIPINASININRKLKVYNFNMYGDLKKIDFDSITIENRDYPICFQFELYDNGSSSSFIVEDTKTQLFYFYTALGSVKIFKSLEKAKNCFLSKSLNPK
jgi:prepilin-type N-terminal cleavage/methylation domain-containing protein